MLEMGWSGPVRIWRVPWQTSRRLQGPCLRCLWEIPCDAPPVYHLLRFIVVLLVLGTAAGRWPFSSCFLGWAATHPTAGCPSAHGWCRCAMPSGAVPCCAASPVASYGNAVCGFLFSLCPCPGLCPSPCTYLATGLTLSVASNRTGFIFLRGGGGGMFLLVSNCCSFGCLWQVAAGGIFLFVQDRLVQSSSACQ